MTDHDPAFLWETEALRGGSRHSRPAEDPTVVAADPPPSGWRTLRDAHEATGIPVDTLRKWARRGVVPTYLDARTEQTHRMVRLDAVIDHATEQGRVLAPAAAPEDSEDRDAVIDLREEPDTPTVSRDGVDAPPGTMIVPIAAWDKMLMQLGNLHEAGQQLAEARERAAKAETEATFLRERLAELRAEGRAARDVESAPPPEPLLTAPAPPSRSSQIWRLMYRSWRARRRR